jgi:hypothetical protein
LCYLRRKRMKIPDNQTLEINMVCPGHEALYAAREKETFLEGKLDGDLKLDNQTTLNPRELDTIWRNTNLFVLRPKLNWPHQIKVYLESENGQDN